MPQGAKAVTAGLLADARPTKDNEYKVPLVERTLAAAISQVRTA